MTYFVTLTWILWEKHDSGSGLLWFLPRYFTQEPAVREASYPIARDGKCCLYTAQLNALWWISDLLVPPVLLCCVGCAGGCLLQFLLGGSCISCRRHLVGKLNLAVAPGSLGMGSGLELPHLRDCNCWSHWWWGHYSESVVQWLLLGSCLAFCWE